MSAISFPQNPNIGEIFTNPNTGSQFQWTGSAWSSYSAPLGISATGPAGSSGTSGFDGVTGPQGIQGEVGPVGPAGLNWRSMWSATGDYLEDDSVGYTGASWFNILGLSGSVSNLPPDQDTTHWSLLASQGSPGQQGPQGLAGTNGTSGSSGSSGSSGLSGVNGTSGTSGSRGATGFTGATGSVIAYPIPDTYTSAQWVLLGTWSTAQGGHTLGIRILSHSGYNAQTTQNQVTDLYFVTSNDNSENQSAVGGPFYASGSASRDTNLGSSSFAPSLIRMVQTDKNTYLIYGYFGTYTANSHYTVSPSPGTTWNASGTLPGITPGGTYLDITPSQIPAVPNYFQTQYGRVTGVNSNRDIFATSFTTNGRPVEIHYIGDGNPAGSASYARLGIKRDSTVLVSQAQIEGSTNENNAFHVMWIDTPPAGTYTYYLNIQGLGGSFDFGEAVGATVIIKQL